MTGAQTSFTKSRSSVRGVLALAAQILLPIEGLCQTLTYVPITVVGRAGNACLTALKTPTTCVSPPVCSRVPIHVPWRTLAQMVMVMADSANVPMQRHSEDLQ